MALPQGWISDEELTGSSLAPAPAGWISDDELVDPNYTVPVAEKPAPKYGLGHDILNTVGGMIGSTGSAVRDLPLLGGIGKSVEDYGQGIVDANPVEVTSAADIIKKPGATVRQAAGNLLPQVAVSTGGGLVGAEAGGAIGAALGAPFAGVGAIPGAAIGATIGGIAGVAAPIFAQEYGGIRQEQRKSGKENIPLALGMGGAATALDTLSPVARVGRNLGMGKLGVRAGENLLASAVKKGAKSAVEEGATEVAQTALERIGGGQELTSQEALDDYAVSGTLGALGGGAVGAVEGSVRKKAKNAPLPTRGQTSLLTDEPKVAPVVPEVAAPPAETVPEVAAPPAEPQAPDELETLDSLRDAFTPEAVTQQLQAAHTDESGAPVAPKDRWLSRLSRDINERLGEDDAAGALQLLADHEENLQTADITPATIERRARVLTKARQVVEDRVAYQQLENEALGEAPASAPAEAAPAAPVAPPEQVAAPAAEDPLAPAIADANATIESSRAKASADARMSLLQSVLDDPTTRNPMGRFANALKRAGYKDISIHGPEAETIARFEDAREAFTAAPVDQSGQVMEPSAPDESGNFGIPERASRTAPVNQIAATPEQVSAPEQPANPRQNRSRYAPENFQLEPPPSSAEDIARVEAAQAKRARRTSRIEDVAQHPEPEQLDLLPETPAEPEPAAPAAAPPDKVVATRSAAMEHSRPMGSTRRRQFMLGVDEALGLRAPDTSIKGPTLRAAHNEGLAFVRDTQEAKPVRDGYDRFLGRLDQSYGADQISQADYSTLRRVTGQKLFSIREMHERLDAAEKRAEGPAKARQPKKLLGRETRLSDEARPEELLQQLDDLGLDSVRLKLMDPEHVADELAAQYPSLGDAGEGMQGWYNDMLALVNVVMGEGDARHTVDHEAIHALRALGAFTEAEWTTLSEAAEKNRKLQRWVRDNYPDLEGDARTEEMVAEMFANWRSGARAGGLVDTVLEKLKTFIDKLAQAIHGAGYTSARQLMRDIQDGKFRPGDAREPTAQPKPMFAGKNARTADRGQLAAAKMMESIEEHPATTRDLTGWHKGPDWGWRFEISDNTAAFDEGAFRAIRPGQGVDLSQVLDHPQLFEAYPELKTMSVFRQSHPLLASVEGWYDRASNSVTVAPKARDPEGILLHELQHVVQGIEDFASGGSMGSVRLSDPNVLNRLEKFYRRVMRAEAEGDPWTVGVFPIGDRLDTVRALRADMEHLKELQAAVDDARAAANDPNASVADQYIATGRQEKAAATLRRYLQQENAQPVMFDAYQLMQGEREARDTAARRRLNAEDRRATPPNSSLASLDDEALPGPRGPKFSRNIKTPGVEQIGELTYALKTVGDVSHRLLLAGLTLGQLVERHGKELVSLRTYYDKLREASARQNAHTLEAWKLKDRWQRVKDRAEQKAIGELLFDATWHQIDPREGVSGGVNAYRAAKLAEAQKALADARKANDAGKIKTAVSQVARAQSELDQHSDTHKELADRLGDMSPEGQKVFADVLDRFAENLKEKQSLYNAMLDKAGLSPEELKSAKRQVAEMFKDIRVYFPLMRFGNKLVIAKSKDYATAERVRDDYRQDLKDLKDAGADVDLIREAQTQLDEANATLEQAKQNGGYIVSAHETEGGMQKEADALKAKGMQVETALKDEFERALDSVSPDFIRKIDELLDAEGGPGAEELRQNIKQMYLTTMPENHALKAGLKRQNVEGFNRDAQRTFAAAMIRDAAYMSRLEFGFDIRQTLASLKEEARGAADRVEAQKVYQEINKRHAGMLTYRTWPGESQMANIGYVWFLGVSPAFAVLNLAQTPMVAGPMIGARFGGMKSAVAITKALTEVSRDLPSAWKDGTWESNVEEMGKNTGEQVMLLTLLERGMLDRTQANDLTSTASSNSPAWNKLMKVASFLPHHTEKVNRVATALAAYRLAEAAGDADPTAYAEKIVNDSHLDYSAENSPRAFKVPYAKVILQFRKYQQGMAYSFIHNFEQTFKGEDKATRKEARRTLVGLLITHGLVAGSMGLPGVTFAAFALGQLHKLFGDDDEPWDPLVAWENWLTQVFGQPVGEMLARGAGHSLLPGDVGARLGQADLFNPLKTRQSGAEGREWWNTILLSLMGPLGTATGDFAEGMKYLGEGDTHKGLELMSPKFLRDISRTLRFSQEGVTNTKGQTLLPGEEFSTVEFLTQAFGLTPTKVSDFYRSRSATMDALTEVKNRRNLLLKRYAEAKIGGDADKVKAATDAIEKFNEVRRKNDEPLITAASRMRAVSSRKGFTKGLTRGVNLKKQEKAFSRYGDFAELPDDDGPDAEDDEDADD